MIMTTSGPGTTNLVTPLQDAYNDTVPLIAFTGVRPAQTEKGESPLGPLLL